MDIGDGVIRAVDSTQDDRESTVAAFEDQANPSFEVLPLAGTVGHIFARCQGWNWRAACGSFRYRASRKAIIFEVGRCSHYVYQRGRWISEGGCEMRSDLDPDEV